jgi:hypothetical protein
MPEDRKIYIIHENSEWTVHLTRRLDQLELPYEEWFLHRGTVDLTCEPPRGVFYSRMSASSHTRNHWYAPELTAAVLTWLERHGRRVFNGSRALQLEVSKVHQYMELGRHGIRTPRTLAVVGREELLTAARRFDGRPFITKHNRAGKGLGTRLFFSSAAMEEYIAGPDYQEPRDGIWLVQEYIEAPEPVITRCEFIGGRFLYAVQVDTSEGFQLCPADACQIGDGFCPAGAAVPVGSGGNRTRPKFKIIDGFADPIIPRYQEFLRANAIDVAGIEFICDPAGRVFTYDVNTNTNYNSDAEDAAGVYAMLELARFLGAELANV